MFQEGRSVVGWFGRWWRLAHDAIQFVKEPANVGGEERSATSYSTWRIPAVINPGRLGLRLWIWGAGFGSRLCLLCRRAGAFSMSPDIATWLYYAGHPTSTLYMWGDERQCPGIQRQISRLWFERFAGERAPGGKPFCIKSDKKLYFLNIDLYSPKVYHPTYIQHNCNQINFCLNFA